MRDEFKALISGWTLVMDDLDNRLEEMARWMENNSPLTPEENKYVQFMIKCQIARNF